MDDSVRVQLVSIVKEQGKKALTNHSQLCNLLLDFCPDKGVEIRIISEALEFKIPQKLKGIDKSAPGVLLGVLSKQFEQEYSKRTIDARWAVGAWATALNILSDAEFKKWHPSPPTVSTLKPVITEESVTLRGQLSSLGTASIVSVSFVYGVGARDYSKVTSSRSFIEVALFDSEPIPIDQLECGRTYYCKAKASGDGEALSNKGARFTLPHKIICTTLRVDSVTSNSARLTGTMESLGVHNSLEVCFEYKQLNDQTIYKSPTQTVNVVADFVAIIQNLLPETLYQCRAVVIGKASVEGLWKDFTTKIIPPIIVKRPYSARITRAEPTALLFLLDQSGSMKDKFSGEKGKRKCDGVADAINHVIRAFVIQSTRVEGIRDFFHIGVIGYADDVSPTFGGALRGRDLVPISLVSDNPLRMEERVQIKLVDNGAGGQIKQPVKSTFPVWVEPKGNGNTVMCRALDYAYRLLSGWIDYHPNCFPPIVINISDGEPTDGDPIGHADRLKALKTTDGNVMLFNFHISSKSKDQILFPSGQEKLPDKHARLLFNISSPLTELMIDRAKLYGISTEKEARGFSFCVSNNEVLVNLLQIGTRTTIAINP